MKNLEVVVIALFSTIASVLTWYILNQLTGENNPFLSSYYSILIFPPLFVALFLFFRKYKKLES
ncbi:MAG: hypothetical protein ACOCSL_02075 [Thermoplasmatota archaeon]